MIDLQELISDLPMPIPESLNSWELIGVLKNLVDRLLPTLSDDYVIADGIAIHRTAEVEKGVTLKAPVIIMAHCMVGANAYFREGVLLGKSVKIGPGSELKSSIICSNTAVAHLNYIGNSIIGSRVNFEAGSIAANHYNERVDKQIKVWYRGMILETGLTKFGAIVGDDSKIGANAVLSPGTILEKQSIVKRLELVEQLGQL